MDITATKDRAATSRPPAWVERETASPSGLWPSLLAVWTRRLDQQIEDDLRWLDHAGAQEDFRRASRGWSRGDRRHQAIR